MYTYIYICIIGGTNRAHYQYTLILNCISLSSTLSISGSRFRTIEMNVMLLLVHVHQQLHPTNVSLAARRTLERLRHIVAVR